MRTTSALSEFGVPSWNPFGDRGRLIGIIVEAIGLQDGWVLNSALPAGACNPFLWAPSGRFGVPWSGLEAVWSILGAILNQAG
eukprot:456701-Pyramimonas_sp.AAC.1